MKLYLVITTIILLTACSDKTEPPLILTYPEPEEKTVFSESTTQNVLTDEDPPTPPPPSNPDETPINNKCTIVISELYIGNTKDANNKLYQQDKYIKLYNNSAENTNIKNLCFAMSYPMMSNITSEYYEYVDLQKTPASQAIWWIENIEFAPYETKVFVVYSAQDHTPYNGVDLSSPQYYCMYDDEAGFTTYYTIPPNNANTLHAIRFANGTAWTIGYSPALFIFSTGDISPTEFAANKENQMLFGDATWWGADNQGKYDTKSGACLMIPNSLIIDGCDVANFTNKNVAQKYNRRFCNEIDAGYVAITASGLGYSIYRNVDKQATLSIPNNENKIVYNYQYGTSDIENGSTDPSDIDAEASIEAGAHIIYQDTNNSTADFHQRCRATLKN